MLVGVGVEVVERHLRVEAEVHLSVAVVDRMVGQVVDRRLVGKTEHMVAPATA